MECGPTALCRYDVKYQKQVSELFHFDLTSNEAALSLLVDNAREEAEVIASLKGSVPKDLQAYLEAAKARQGLGPDATVDQLLAGDPDADAQLVDRVTRDTKLLENEAVSRLSEIAAVRQLIRDGRTRAPQALFTHTYGDVENLFVVVRIEKVLEGDLQKVRKCQGALMALLLATFVLLSRCSLYIVTWCVTRSLNTTPIRNLTSQRKAVLVRRWSTASPDDWASTACPLRGRRCLSKTRCAIVSETSCRLWSWRFMLSTRTSGLKRS